MAVRSRNILKVLFTNDRALYMHWTASFGNISHFITTAKQFYCIGIQGQKATAQLQVQAILDLLSHGQ